MWWAGLRDSSVWSISTTRSRRAGGSSPATRGGPSCAAATWEEGEPQGLPVWSRHVGDPILESNLTRRVDFARFMVEAIENDELVHEAPAIVGCQTPSALAHAAKGSPAFVNHPRTSAG